MVQVTGTSTFEEFLATQGAQIPIWGFLVNLLLAAALSFILGQVYIYYGDSLSNKRAFARNFVIMAATTTLIITVVKSSLALSLGLVGALSIVRFRAAIKEPEELAYLFLTISIGLGFGADQRLVTTVAILLIISIIILRKKLVYKPKENQNLHLTVSSSNPGKIDLNQIVTILNNYCSSVNMKRFDETDEILEASFLVDFEDYEKIEKVRSELSKLSKLVKVTFLDSQGAY
ncbi:MAG: DUF4956 domain-containing protein [Caldisericota bacterium]|nr:DUF4956 domain-containing protein [Thermotogota bacterium]MEA3313856.1 DUF4956 domain-containing protein [Caldisericota bacterium]